MNIQLTDISATRKSLVVTLDKSEVDAEHQAVVAEFVRQARLPGFRPGKAPAAMIAKRFAKDITDEFKQKVVAKAYKEAMDKQKLEVITIAKVEEARSSPAFRPPSRSRSTCNRPSSCPSTSACTPRCCRPNRPSRRWIA